jgi:predicted nucleotidyltransferase
MEQTIIDAVVSKTLKHYPSLEAIYIYGSFATGEVVKESDVDIALLFPPLDQPSKHLCITDLHEELEGYFSREIDLVNLRRVSTILQKEVIFCGERIYTDGTSAADEFEIVVMSMYQHLKEETADIIEDALRTGRFYNV